MINKHKRQKKNTSASTNVSNNIPVLASKGDNSPGDIEPPSQKNQMNQYPSNSFANSGSKSNMMRYGVQTDIFISNPTFASRNHDSDREYSQILVRLNHHKNDCTGVAETPVVFMGVAEMLSVWMGVAETPYDLNRVAVTPSVAQKERSGIITTLEK